MAEADYIPAGRTSRISKNQMEIQIQTEYAHRPQPRLTTSIITKGQVIRKIQQLLDNPISSIEEKVKIERMLQKQHAEVLEVVKRDNFTIDIGLKENNIPRAESKSLYDRLAQINGVVNVFKIDNEGNFESSNVSQKFKKYFKPIFKNISGILEIFQQLPGGRRESGIVEIDRRRLFLVSNGSECYFILMDGLTPSGKVEAQIKDVLYS